jgi:hypothetical protein
MIKVEVVVEQQMAQVVEEQQMANEINQKRLKIVHTCSNANCTHILKSGTAYTTVKKSDISRHELGCFRKSSAMEDQGNRIDKV